MRDGSGEYPEPRHEQDDATDEAKSFFANWLDNMVTVSRVGLKRRRDRLARQASEDQESA